MRYSIEERQWDLGSLLAAETPDDLHRALVLQPPAAIERETSLPLALLRQVHPEASNEASKTVVLLATDKRFSSVTGLMAALVGSGLVPTEVVDLLAESFAVAGRTVWWACPDAWFDAELVIDLRADIADGAERAAGADEIGAGDEDEPGPAMAERWVTTDARRWAVAHLVRREPDRWAACYRLAGEAPAKVAAGILFGLLDAADALGDSVAEFVEHAAMAAGDAGVRLAAVTRLAGRDPEAARARAESDPNARVRAWAQTLGATTKAGPAEASPESSPDRPAQARSGPTQATLF